MLAELPGAREQWLARTVERVQARAVWLAGSAGSGRTDEWSDLDLVLVDGTALLEDALLAWENPGNGPVGGSYYGSLFAAGPLTLWVDWYLWPADAPAPSDARLLRGHSAAGKLDLSQSLERLGRGRPRPHADRDAFTLAMLPLAAKFVARGRHEKAASMAAMLGAPRNLPVLEALRVVFDGIDAVDTANALAASDASDASAASDAASRRAEARGRVDLYLQVVEAVSRDRADPDRADRA
jgi:hypothetical protein